MTILKIASFNKATSERVIPSFCGQSCGYITVSYLPQTEKQPCLKNHLLPGNSLLPEAAISIASLNHDAGNSNRSPHYQHQDHRHRALRPDRVLGLAAHNARKIPTLPASIMDDVLAKVTTLFE